MNNTSTGANVPTIRSLIAFLGVIGIILLLLTAVDYLTVSPTHEGQTQCYLAEGQGLGFYVPLGWASTSGMLSKAPNIMYFCAKIDEQGILNIDITRPMPKDAILLNIPRYAQDPHDKILADLNKSHEDLGKFRDLVQRQNTAMEQMYNYISQLEQELDRLNQPVN